jgi:hypothetical protein
MAFKTVKMGNSEHRWPKCLSRHRSLECLSKALFQHNKIIATFVPISDFAQEARPKHKNKTSSTISA